MHAMPAAPDRSPGSAVSSTALTCAAVFRPGPSTLRCLALLVLLGSGLGVALAGEPMRLAALMPALIAEPVADTPRAAAVAPVDEVHPARRALELKPIYDTSNPAYLRLQRIDEATRQLPRDAVGFPDWMAALRSGAITPRAGLSVTDKMNVLDLDVVMKNTKEMPHVVFPHRSHTLWLDCSNCHPAPFVPKAGANPVSMSEIFGGKYCGMCHDRVAFITFFACNRCHSAPQAPAVQTK